MEKKPYSPPTVTQQGNAVEQTNGFGGRYWELVALRMSPEQKGDD